MPFITIVMFASFLCVGMFWGAFLQVCKAARISLRLYKELFLCLDSSMSGIHLAALNLHHF